MECGKLNSIKTSKPHHVKKEGVTVHDVNIKAAGTMILLWLLVIRQKFMTSLEVTPVSARTLKKGKRNKSNNRKNC